MEKQRFDFLKSKVYLTKKRFVLLVVGYPLKLKTLKVLKGGGHALFNNFCLSKTCETKNIKKYKKLFDTTWS